VRLAAALFLGLCPLCWTWDRVVTDCHGAADLSVTHYYWVATVRVTQAATCTDGQGLPYPCTSTIPGTPLRFGPDFDDPGVGVTVSTILDPVEDPSMLPTPAVGGLAAWPWPSADNPDPVLAIDGAGNTSKPCAP
jgi:hypothetical protein